MSCGVGHRHNSDPTLLWLWRKLAAAAPIRPLSWEPPYAAGAALEKAKKKKKKKKLATALFVAGAGGVLASEHIGPLVRTLDCFS